MTWLIVALLGVLGVLCRFVTGQWASAFAVTSIPVATLIVNVSGSAVGGLILGSPMLAERLSGTWHTAITVGFLGGLTTFSALSMDTVRLFQNGQLSVAFLNLFLNNFCGIVACFLCFKLSARFL